MEKTQNEKIAFALNTLRPKAEYSLIGDDYANIEWLDKEQTAPTWSEVQAEINNPTPAPEPTLSQKLASVGVTIDDLKAALGL
jgi:hypothetical protein